VLLGKPLGNTLGTLGTLWEPIRNKEKLKKNPYTHPKNAFLAWAIPHYKLGVLMGHNTHNIGESKIYWSPSFLPVGSLTAEETGSSDRPPAPPTRHPLSVVVFIYFLPFTFFYCRGLIFLLARKGGVLWPCSCLSLSLLFPAHFPTPIASSFSHGALRPAPPSPQFPTDPEVGSSHP
jgi:hypothetical protein